MNTTKVVESLQKEAASNPVFNAVAHMFAMRKRTRYMVTVRNLQIVMRKEGFKFTKEQYAGVLVFLANLGVGTIYKNTKGQVQALKDINFALASIGKTALAEAKTVKQQRKFKKARQLPQEVEAIHKTDFMDKRSPLRKPMPYPAFLTVLIEGRPVNFAGPKDLTADNLADFLVSFKRVADKDDL